VSSLHRLRPTLLLGCGLATIALAGCGGSTSSTTTNAARTVTATAAAAATTPTSSAGARAGARSASSGKAHGKTNLRTTAAAQPATAGKTHGRTKLHATVYNPPKQQTASTTPALSTPGAQNPCVLVSESQAASILGGSIHAIEAPLGPTCVYQANGTRQSVTVAVQTANVAGEVALMKKKPAQLTIGGHTAYCGTLGTSQLLVELGGRRTLKISATCAQAKALAAIALPRIAS
jgi:hypothetical protein